MIRATCPSCRLIWSEDRSAGDSPASPHAFACPRCGTFAQPELEHAIPPSMAPVPSADLPAAKRNVLERANAQRGDATATPTADDRAAVELLQADVAERFEAIAKARELADRQVARALEERAQADEDVEAPEAPTKGR